MDASTWDERYREKELVWGIAPNRWVEQEIATERPGTALDVACGEGRNALWLASLGWDVTAVDFSPVAIDKARTLATTGRRPVVWVVADALTYHAPEPVDLVLVCYLQLGADERRQAMRAAAESVASGGTLLVIAHDSTNLTGGAGGPPDAAVLYTAEDVRADLDGTGLIVTRAEAVLRPVAGADRPAIDVLFRARREGARNLQH